MIRKAEAMGGVDISAALRSLPRKIYMGDLFSGTGSCTLVSKTLFGQLKKLYPEECEGMEATWVRFELTLILFPPSNNVCFLGQAKRLALTVSCTFPTVLQVVYEFMCEKEPYKRRFLEEAFPDEDCCIFKDATELYTDKRACARHDKGGGCQCDSWFQFQFRLLNYHYHVY